MRLITPALLMGISWAGAAMRSPAAGRWLSPSPPGHPQPCCSGRKRGPGWPVGKAGSAAHCIPAVSLASTSGPAQWGRDALEGACLCLKRGLEVSWALCSPQDPGSAGSLLLLHLHANCCGLSCAGEALLSVNPISPGFIPAEFQP